jgi:hypothetical protein
VNAPRRRGGRALAWALFVAWAVWLSAAQGWLTRGGGSAWVPDAALVLAVVVLARCEAADLLPLALLTALARSATSGDPPIVLAAGALGALLAALAVRDALELSGPAGRALGAGLAAGLFQAWLGVAHAVRAPHAVLDPLAAAGTALPVALASALLALLLGPLLARLPGLTPLRSRTW